MTAGDRPNECFGSLARRYLWGIARNERASLSEEARAIATDAEAARAAAFEALVAERLGSTYSLARLLLRDAQE